MRLTVRLLAAFTISGLLHACDNPSGDCAAPGAYAVRANITDSLTGAPLAYRASLIIREGAYVDSVPWVGSVADSARVGFLEGALDREGTYSVAVRREGSRVWTRAGVQARKEDGCLLKQAVLTVRLQPAG